LGRGFDGAHFISGLSEHFRNLLVSKDQATLKLLEVSDGIKAKYLQQAQASTVSFLLSALNIGNQCDLSYRLSKNQRLQVELALLKMCNLLSVFNLASGVPVAMPSEGQLKKKPEPAALAPAKEQQISPGVVIASEPEVGYRTTKPTVADAAPTPATVAEKPKIIMPKTGSLSPSLKDFRKTAEAIKEEEDPYIRGDAKDAYTSEQFSKCWSNFAARLKADGKKNALTIFISNPPKLIGVDNYEVIVENKMQETVFRDERPALLNCLRTGLRNFNIEVSVRIDEVAVVRRPYTASEKFQHMAAKNPALAELKTKFNLDFD
jgi:DNA polymerase-3 subunit gamma/tau